MEISFTNKDSQNKLQEEEFVRLSPVERVKSFIMMSQQINSFPQKQNKENNQDNFVISFYD
jgi:hypothetical protein